MVVTPRPRPPLVSIVICTRNRAATLGRTLDAVRRLAVPADLPAELLVVDNGSSDATREVVAAWHAPAIDRRYVFEERPGLATARNTALAVAAGTALLFLDDDVVPPTCWLEVMSRPILSGAADAVAGGVRIAGHLERPWMEAVHRTWLASTDFLDAAAPQEMVGANMAFGRHVLAKVPAFDTELGLGALGQGEDALFSRQLLRAGFRIASALDVAVQHHFDPSRLLRASFRDSAERRGRTMSYQQYHWEHLAIPDAARRWRRAWLRFALRRLARGARRPHGEGMPGWEMLARERLAFLRHWQSESRRPRHYDRFGLTKRAGVG